MTRTHLEARLIAFAIVRPELARELPTLVDRNAVTVACWALIRQLAEPDSEGVRATTTSQRRLADLAEGITVAQLLDWSSDVIIETINREGWSDVVAPAAWERDLARGVAA
jgi:hypothetical protein